MTSRSIVRGFARNNAWSNHRLLRACAELTRDELHTTRTSFFPTIMKTLNHIVTVDWYYIDALANEGRGRSVFEPEEPFADLEPLAMAQRASDLKLIEIAESIDLDSPVRIDREAGIRIDTAQNVLLHLAVHQIHHRGQVHAMLSGTHVAPPQLDEFFLVEDLPLRAADLAEIGLPAT